MFEEWADKTSGSGQTRVSNAWYTIAQEFQSGDIDSQNAVIKEVMSQAWEEGYREGYEAGKKLGRDKSYEFTAFE